MHLPKHAVNCPINMVNLQQINIYEGKKKKRRYHMLKPATT